MTTYNISNMTPQVVRLLTEQVLKDGSCGFTVITKRKAKKRVYGSLNGNKVVWEYHDWQRGYLPLTRELERVLDPESAAKHVAEKQAAKNAANAVAEAAINDGLVKIGSVFGGHYGYDATFWDFYEVVSLSASGKSCQIRPLKCLRQDTGFCTWQLKPVPGTYAGKAEQHRINYAYGSPSIKISSFESLYLLDEIRWFDCDDYH